METAPYANRFLFSQRDKQDEKKVDKEMKADEMKKDIKI